MDSDLCDMNLFFLQKAREWLLSGQEHKAQALLGLTPEAARWLKRVPLTRLKDLAASPALCFRVRFPPQLWRDLALEDGDQPWPPSLRWQILASAVAEESHGDHTA